MGSGLERSSASRLSVRKNTWTAEWRLCSPWKMHLLERRELPPPVSTLSCLPLPPSASAPLTLLSPRVCLGLTAFTVAHHQPPANHHQYDVSFPEYISPIIKNMSFLSSLQVSPPSISATLPDMSWHQRCPVYPCCLYHLPGCRNILLSSTSSPKSL